MVQEILETLEKSGNQYSGHWNPEKVRILSVFVRNQEMIACSDFLECTSHILYILCYDESKWQHKMVPTTVFFCTLSLVFETLNYLLFSFK